MRKLIHAQQPRALEPRLSIAPYIKQLMRLTPARCSNATVHANFWSWFSTGHSLPKNNSKGFALDIGNLAVDSIGSLIDRHCSHSLDDH